MSDEVREAAGVAWGQGVALSGLEREVREVKRQVQGLTELLTDVMVRVGTLEELVKEDEIAPHG